MFSLITPNMERMCLSIFLQRRNTNSTPIYQSKWFIIVILVVLLGLLAVCIALAIALAVIVSSTGM